MRLLRHATASQEALIGPFIDTAGAPVTSLTIANTDIELYKAGATTHVDKNSGGATHSSKGMYSVVFDATDTDTIGSGEAYVQVSGALPCKLFFCVLDETVYDVLFGTTAPSTLDAAGIRTAVGMASADLDDQIATLAVPGDEMALDAAGIASILDAALDGTLTLSDLLLIAASWASKMSGAPSGPLVVRNPSDTKNVISMTPDANGNRTAVTFTP